jgi:alpha-beta hydrolase superfamily lysophospholipase
MPESQVEVKSKDGLKLVGREWKPAGRPRGVVCLIPGMGEHTGRYPHVAAAFNQAGYAVLGLDLRGHGLSEGRRGFTPGYDAYLDDVEVLLGEVGRRYPATPTVLYGHSLGATIALYYGLRRKTAVAGIVASSPQLRLAFVPPAWKVALVRVMATVWPTFTIASELEQAALSRDSEVVRAYAADPLVHDRLSARMGIGLIDIGRWLLDHAAEFTRPLLIYCGGKDRLVSPDACREFAAKVKADCTIKIWEGLYHETHNEPEKMEVLAFVTEWMKAHTH